MIFTERKITVNKGQSTIDRPVILYRGDYEVEIRFTIVDNDFKYIDGNNNNATEKASHAQLAVLGPDGTNVFSDISVCTSGQVAFVLTKEMIDELSEVGKYSFQFRLFDYYRESRVSIPPVEYGIEVREPIASEDHTNAVDNSMVGYSIAKTSVLDEPVPETFDNNGQYNKTDWETGDRISEGKLNKIEDAIDKINQNELADKKSLNKQMSANFNVMQTMINNLVVESGNTDAEVIQSHINLDGKNFNVLKNNLDNIEYTIKENLSKIDEGYWENGNIVLGDNVNQYNSLRSIEYISIDPKYRLIVKNNDLRDIYFKIVFYDEKSSFIDEEQPLITSNSVYEFNIPTAARKARFTIGVKNGLFTHEPSLGNNVIIYSDDTATRKICELENTIQENSKKIDSLEGGFGYYSITEWENGSIIGGLDQASSSDFNIRSVGFINKKSNTFAVKNNKETHTIYCKIITYTSSNKMVEETIINNMIAPGDEVKATVSKAFDKFRVQLGIKGNAMELDPSWADDVDVGHYQDLDITFWSYKKWVSYGDSLTGGATWEWQPTVIQALNIRWHGKRGIGGTTVSRYGNRDNPFCDDTRIDNSIDADAELVTIFGGHNDFGTNCPLGDLSYPFDEYTFKGALASTILKIQNRLTSNNAYIVVLTTANTRGKGTDNATSHEVNSIGLTHDDYAKACKEVAEFMSVPYIDVYGTSGINIFNRSKYVQDNVHPNELGFKKIGQCVSAGLKRIEGCDI